MTTMRDKNAVNLSIIIGEPSQLTMGWVSYFMAGVAG